MRSSRGSRPSHLRVARHHLRDIAPVHNPAAVGRPSADLRRFQADAFDGAEGTLNIVDDRVVALHVFCSRIVQSADPPSRAVRGFDELKSELRRRIGDSGDEDLGSSAPTARWRIDEVSIELYHSADPDGVLVGITFEPSRPIA